jgi:hypothetical protein
MRWGNHGERFDLRRCYLEVSQRQGGSRPRWRDRGGVVMDSGSSQPTGRSVGRIVRSLEFSSESQTIRLFFRFRPLPPHRGGSALNTEGQRH